MQSFLVTLTTISIVYAKTSLNESDAIALDKRAHMSYFEIMLNGNVAAISSILAPNTGKVIQIERITGGRAGTTHSQEIDVQSARARPLVLPADSWCSGGFISPEPSGRVVNIAGFSGQALDNIIDFTSCGTPGTFGTCDWRNLATISSSTLLRYRWYPTSLPLPSGRVAVISGSTSATGVLPAPTFESNMEFIPRLPNEQVIPIKLLADTEADSLYPIAHVLANGYVFLLSGKSSGLYDHLTFQPIPNIKLPDIEGKRTYPLAGSSVLLPLDPSNNYKSEVMVCGGSSDYTKTAPALQSCGRMDPLDPNPVWQMSIMRFPRVMPDMVILPNGNIFIANGAAIGWQGFDTSEAPVLTSEIYNPNTNRFILSATSTIPRLYHSEAILLEDGRVMISGSTPNPDANVQTTPYADETRIELYTPAYLTAGFRPTISSLSSKTWTYGQTVAMSAFIPSGNYARVSASLFTNGFVTHSLHMGQRSVKLEIRIVAGNRFELISPPNANILPPGWYMLFVMDANVPAVAQWIQVGGDPAGMANWPQKEAPVCNNFNGLTRTDCGVAGTTQTECESKGCCWSPLLTTLGPWCYSASPPVTQPVCANISPNARVDCGVLGETQKTCMDKGCCWNPLQNNVAGPWCFRAATCQPNLPVAQRKDCGYYGITIDKCQERGCCWGLLPAGVNGPVCYN